MSGSLVRRLAALEMAPENARQIIRVYHTHDAAQADTEPAPAGVSVVKIVTGVPRPEGSPERMSWDAAAPTIRRP